MTMTLDAVLLEYPGLVRGVLVGVLFATLLAFEAWRPRRSTASGWQRRFRNIALSAISAMLVYLLLPITTIALAYLVQQQGWGALNRVDWPLGLELLISVVALDLAIYWQHRWFHEVRALWPIHRVHHSDTAFDVSLGLRFHPAEIVLSLIYKFALIALLGISPLGIVAYELLLAAFALMTHANVALPPRIDAGLRTLFVTPDWHRVHHSVQRDETDSNYGNILAIWDRLFRSYVRQPREGHAQMRMGLHAFREPVAQTLPALLLQPVRRESKPAHKP